MEAKTNAALERQCLNRLTAAVVLSAVLHLVAYAGLQVAKRADFSLPRLPQLVKISLPAPTPVVTEKKVSLTFVTVDPDTAQTTAPKNPKFYSTHSTVAAQPAPAKTKAELTKVEGKKSEVPKIADVPVPSPKPILKTVAKVEPKNAALPLQPKPLQPAPPPEPKPRTLAEAKAEQKAGGIFTEKSHQEGNAPRVGRLAFEAAGTPFGVYDAKFIAAVQEQWYTLLQNRNGKPGRVVVDFRLHDDGRITDLRVAETSVDALLSYICEQAILKPAPYERWPKTMRETVGAPQRDVRFTFHYN